VVIFKFFSLLLSCALFAMGVSGCGVPQSDNLPPLDPSAYSTAPTDSVEISIIDSMFNEINYAFEESSAKGFEAAFRHIYPNSLDLVKATQCAQALVDQEVTWEMFFNSSSASLLTQWVAPESPDDDWVFAGQSPEGNTYIANVSGVRAGGLANVKAGMGFTHITVLNGEVLRLQTELTKLQNQPVGSPMTPEEMGVVKKFLTWIRSLFS
jgi:hypothetical protein